MNTKLILPVAALSLMACGVQANTISGKLYKVPEAVAQNAIPANVPAGTADVSFDVNSPFNFNIAGPDSVGNWLGSSSAFNIVENTAGTLASLMDDGTTGTLLDFNGLVTVNNGDTFTVTHDDGLTLIINGVNLGFNPGPTAPNTDTLTYNGASGTFPFELVYDECCGGPAVLQVSLPFVNAPDAGSTAMFLGGALALLGTFSRRFRK